MKGAIGSLIDCVSSLKNVGHIRADVLSVVLSSRLKGDGDNSQHLLVCVAVPHIGIPWHMISELHLWLGDVRNTLLIRAHTVLLIIFFGNRPAKLLNADRIEFSALRSVIFLRQGLTIHCERHVG